MYTLGLGWDLNKWKPPIRTPESSSSIEAGDGLASASIPHANAHVQAQLDPRTRLTVVFRRPDEVDDEHHSADQLMAVLLQACHRSQVAGQAPVWGPFAGACGVE